MIGCFFWPHGKYPPGRCGSSSSLPSAGAERPQVPPSARALCLLQPGQLWGHCCPCPFPLVLDSEFLRGLLEILAAVGLRPSCAGRELSGTMVLGSQRKTRSSVCCCSSLCLGCGYPWRWGDWNEKCSVKMHCVSHCGET